MSTPQPSETARIEIAIAVVRHQDRVLIGRRGDEGPLAGFWEFPGGKLAAGETTAAAAVRECREEAGLAITVVGTLDVVEHDYEHGPLRLSFHDCRPVDADRVDAADVGIDRDNNADESFRWVTVDRLAEYKFPPANAAVVKMLMTRGK
jgi:8-oxo-dGTP diphosphatase